MITGIGTDLVEIARVQKAIGRSAFLERVYTEKERELIAVRPVRAASNFAAKEAVAKALGCGFSGIAPIEIEILRHPSGMPYVELHGRAKKKAEEQGISSIRLSLTDTAEYAQAYVICEGETNGATGTDGTDDVIKSAGTASQKPTDLQKEALPILDAAGMKEVDRITIEEVGIPSLVLMERAALSVVDCVKEYATTGSYIGVLCGTGNNGGDGVAVARLLKEEGYHADVLLKDASLYREMHTKNREQSEAELSRPVHGTQEFLQQLKIAKEVGVGICEPADTGKYEIIVDALFGIGLSKPVEGEYASLLERLNEETHTVIAVDIPSGISASDGTVCGVALRADETVTFGGAKWGHLLYPGKEYTGKLRVATIGFPKELLQEKKQGIYITPDNPGRILPERPAYSNKGTFGKVAVIAGSNHMAGAAYFAACAAYRMGVGLVKIVTPECNREILQTLLPEAVLTTYGGPEEYPELVKETLQFADAIIVGPGLGQSEEAERLVSCFREAMAKKTEGGVPSVWDADALNLLAKKMDREGHSSMVDRVACLDAWLPKGAVLTPHPGELSRLLGISVQEITGNFLATARRLASESKLVYVLKDAATLVVRGTECFCNTAGNNGMATGGSGDVLCGVIAALLAGGLDNFTAATAGVLFHGLAGDRAKCKTGAVSMIARDIIKAIGELIEEKGKEVVK